MTGDRGIRRTYVAPAVVAVGTVAEVTQSNVRGAYTDASFPVHTPVGSLTFSG